MRLNDAVVDYEIVDDAGDAVAVKSLGIVSLGDSDCCYLGM